MLFQRNSVWFHGSVAKHTIMSDAICCNTRAAIGQVIPQTVPRYQVSRRCWLPPRFCQSSSVGRRTRDLIVAQYYSHSTASWRNHKAIKFGLFGPTWSTTNGAIVYYLQVSMWTWSSCWDLEICPISTSDFFDAEILMSLNTENQVLVLSANRRMKVT